MFGEESRSNHKQFLFRRIAWRIQALAEGGLSERARRRALEIANDADLRIRAPKTKFGPDVTLDPKLSVSRKVASALDSRLPPPGTYLEREYKGRRVIVKVLVNGFEFDGEVILLMTLTLASMQFSPRIIVSFSRDRVTQWTLGIFLGTFSYCMAALPAARTLPHPFAPVATVLGAMVLALVCIGLLLFFIHHISQAISVNHIVDRIAEETEAMIDEMMPSPHRLNRLKDA